mmetsp:Transcript_13151/g.52690  ORF Transcript_13151/g.52690 Transcript_13151/m.52690 type:complete len:309 (+) Transcript_13151:408-1334(+)
MHSRMHSRVVGVWTRQLYTRATGRRTGAASCLESPVRRRRSESRGRAARGAIPRGRSWARRHDETRSGSEGPARLVRGALLLRGLRRGSSRGLLFGRRRPERLDRVGRDDVQVERAQRREGPLHVGQRDDLGPTDGHDEGALAGLLAVDRDARLGRRREHRERREHVVRRDELRPLTEDDEREPERDAEPREDEVVGPGRAAPAAADLARHEDAEREEEAGLDGEEEGHHGALEHALVDDLADLDDHAHDLGLRVEDALDVHEAEHVVGLRPRLGVRRRVVRLDVRHGAGGGGAVGAAGAGDATRGVR